ncbi:MAG: hypothetical protein FWG91_00390 [Lachnospiraceae bacterium]|nr:hypothetical protein [Lachnospiraceae bacterium]
MNFNIICDNDAEEIALWFDEKLLDNDFIYIDPYIHGHYYKDILFLRDSIFNLRLWGTYSKNEHGINALFLLNMPEAHNTNFRFANAITYDSPTSDLFLYTVEKLKEEYDEEIAKIKFRYLFQKTTVDKSLASLPDLQKEIEYDTGNGIKKIYSYFL